MRLRPPRATLTDALLPYTTLFRSAATRTTTSPRSAAVDRGYADLVRQPLSCAGMVHLRWATGGLDVRPENTHPFFDDDFAFAHNGHVSPISELEELLSPASRAALVGDTEIGRASCRERVCKYV